MPWTLSYSVADNGRASPTEGTFTAIFSYGNAGPDFSMTETDDNWTIPKRNDFIDRCKAAKAAWDSKNNLINTAVTGGLTRLNTP